MPIPTEALAALLSRKKSQDIEDWSKGLLLDQRVPSTFGSPPLQLRDQGAISGETFNPTNREHSFPLIPVSDANGRSYDWQMGDLATTDGYTPEDEAAMAQQAREAAALRGRQGYEAAAARPQESNRLNAVAGALGSVPYALGSLAAMPGQTMTENPYKPGSEEWQFYEDQRRSNTYRAAPELAFNLMGAGTSLAPSGALGMAGGRMKPEPLTGFAPEGKGVIGDLFDYSKVHEIPAVKQYDLPRYEPPRGVSERVQDLVSNKKVEQKMLDYIGKGKDIKAETFYYNEPLREAFVAELGKKKGEPAFARYMDYVAATSPRSDVETNARNASYYYWLERQGKPVPPQGGVNPQPYGHMAQNLHRENAEKIRSGEYFDVVNNPKPLSFSQNLQGNFNPVTVDAHAFKLPAILARDPEFLAGSLKLEKGAPTINPTKMYESGDLTMREAAQRPVYWAARPNRNEYGAMEQYYKRLAAEAGMTPAQTQAAAWAGGGKVTGLESVAGDPFMRSVENRAIKTAAERGISPEEALSQMMRGKAPLLGLGGAAMGSLAAQDQYQ